MLDYFTLVIVTPDRRHDTVHVKPVDYGTQGYTTWTTTDPAEALREAERIRDARGRSVDIRHHSRGGAMLINTVYAD